MADWRLPVDPFDDPEARVGAIDGDDSLDRFVALVTLDRERESSAASLGPSRKRSYDESE
jgi:hypothetical protein